MTSELLTVAGITTLVVLIFTLLFQYIPGLRLWWAALKTEAKKGIVLVLYLITGAVVAFGGCFPAFASVFPQVICAPLATFVDFAFGTLIAIGAGQGAFSLMPELGDVEARKALRPA